MPSEIKVLYQFEDFRLDAARRCLWRDGDLVSLTPKALETLLVLVKHKGAVVEKDTLLDEVWADTFVEEATLAQNISTLRKVLGSQSGKPFIETVPRRGYRFVAEVKEIASDEELFIIEKHRRTNVIATQEIHHSDDTASEQTIATAIDITKYVQTQTTIGMSKPSVFTKSRIITATAIAIVIAIISFTLIALRPWYKPNFAESKFIKPKFSRLSSGSNINRAALAPDGKYLAQVEKRGAGWSLQVRQLNNNNSVEIFSDPNSQMLGLNFSPDSQSIYYTVYPNKPQPDGVRVGVLYRIPMLGGVPEQIVTDIDSSIAFAPDNQQIAFARHSQKNDQSAIIIAGLDGRPEKTLINRPIKKSFSTGGPAWSPDGKTIVCGANTSSGIDSWMEIVSVNVETGEAKSLIEHPFKWVGQSAWLKDGSGVLFPAFSTTTGNFTDEVWLASFPEGKLRAVTNGVTGLYGMSITADSKAFVTIKSSHTSNFWFQQIQPTIGESQRTNQTFAESSAARQEMLWTPDGKVIFDSTRNGNSDIWLMNADGTNLKPLTSDPQADYSPSLSPDGKVLVFLSNRTGKSNIWKMNADGTDVKQLTNLSDGLAASISNDGNFVYFCQKIGSNNFPFLFKVPIDGGEPIQLTNQSTLYPRISPDGKFIACFFADQEHKVTFRLSTISTETGALVKQFNVPGLGATSKLSWSQDGKKIFYLVNQLDGTATIFQHSLDTDSSTKVIESKNDSIFRFALSGDDNRLAYETGGYIQEIILAENE